MGRLTCCCWEPRALEAAPPEQATESSNGCWEGTLSSTQMGVVGPPGVSAPHELVITPSRQGTPGPFVRTDQTQVAQEDEQVAREWSDTHVHLDEGGTEWVTSSRFSMHLCSTAASRCSLEPGAATGAAAPRSLEQLRRQVSAAAVPSPLCTGGSFMLRTAGVTAGQGQVADRRVYSLSQFKFCGQLRRSTSHGKALACMATDRSTGQAVAVSIYNVRDLGEAGSARLWHKVEAHRQLRMRGQQPHPHLVPFIAAFLETNAKGRRASMGSCLMASNSSIISQGGKGGAWANILSSSFSDTTRDMGSGTGGPRGSEEEATPSPDGSGGSPLQGAELRGIDTEPPPRRLLVVLQGAPTGPTLASLFKGPVPKDEVAACVLRPLLAALSALHGAGSAHGALSPGTIFMEPGMGERPSSPVPFTGGPRSGDAAEQGLPGPAEARASFHGLQLQLFDFAVPEASLEKEEVLRGNGMLTYTPPEVLTVCAGADKASGPMHGPCPLYQPPSDIWAVGCLTLELLLGFLPPRSALTARLPSQASGAAWDFVGCCLEEDPSCRPSAAELLQHPLLHAANT